MLGRAPLPRRGIMKGMKDRPPATANQHPRRAMHGLTWQRPRRHGLRVEMKSIKMCGSSNTRDTATGSAHEHHHRRPRLKGSGYGSSPTVSRRPRAVRTNFHTIVNRQLLALIDGDRRVIPGVPRTCYFPASFGSVYWLCLPLPHFG